MIGEFLYALTQKDIISQPVLQRAAGVGAASAAATSVTFSFPAVPADRVMVLNNISAIGIAGAAQTTSEVAWDVLDSAGNTMLSVANDFANPAIQRWGFSAALELWLMQGEVLRCTARYSAGGVANTLSCSFSGIFLPKGNLQLR